MSHRPSRRVLFAVLGLGSALALQGCGSDSSAAPSPAAASTAATSAATSAAATPTPEETDDDSCDNDEVKADVTFQPQGVKGDTRLGLVALANSSDESCSLNGNVRVVLTNAADEAVDVKTTEVDQPGAPVAVTLKPGTTAFAGIKWTVCDKGDATCATGNGMRVGVADGEAPYAKLEGFPAAEKSDITMKTLEVGTIQPSRQGVVAW